MPKYPTKKEILSSLPIIKKETIRTVLFWKKNNVKNWKNKSNETKLIRLEFLIDILNQIEKGKELKIRTSNSYCYNPKTKEIFQDESNPSIISALHELAHHLYGSKELTACAWSIKLFSTCFPGLFKRLEWKEHLLIKQNNHD